MPLQIDLAEGIIFKGVKLLGINGRLMFKTWQKMAAMLESGALNVRPVVTHEYSLDQFDVAMQLMKSPQRECGKIVLRVEE